nr:DNA methyltransferase [Pararhodospirillum photometricum]
MILWLTKPGPAVRGPRTIGTVIPAKRVPPARRHHPTEKPIDVLTPLLEALVPESGVVADPFAGSGSTGVAALATGRKAWLSDADPHFVEGIRSRLRAL